MFNLPAKTACPLAFVLGTVLILGACSGGGGGDDAPLAEPSPVPPLQRDPCIRLQGTPGPEGAEEIDVEVVVQGLEVPWGLAFLPSGDILVSERPGRLRLARQGEVLPQPVLEIDVAEVAVIGGFEGGLLDVLLHPQFSENRWFYLFYTIRKPNDAVVSQLVRYKLSQDGRSAALDRVILDDLPAGGHHQGGRMRIGPDGLLYLGVGAFDPPLAQDPGSLAGKLLRLDLEGNIPPDNPDPASYVFISGIRNTQGYDWFDERYWLIMDHGPSRLELDMPNLGGNDEFNVASAGENLAWPTMWGCETSQDMVEPVMSWEEPMPPGGALRYRGTAYPQWQGDFLVTSLGFDRDNGQNLMRIVLNPDNPYQVTAHHVYLKNDYGRLRTIVEDAQGRLYITTSNCDGRGTCPAQGDVILRITAVR